MKFETKKRNEFGCVLLRIIYKEPLDFFKLDFNEGGRWLVFHLWYHAKVKFFIYLHIRLPFCKWFKWHKLKDYTLKRKIKLEV